MKETQIKPMPNDPETALYPALNASPQPPNSILLFRGDKWMRVEAGSEMERRGRAKGWTEFGPGRELEHMSKSRLMEVAENLRSYNHDLEFSPRDSKPELIEKIKAATSPETDE